MNLARRSLALLLLLLACGCASTEMANSSGATTLPHANCLVCKMNFDLACIDVAVDDKTPKFMFNGQTYFFCSDECRDKFAKEPTKYLEK